ncbi:MAG TPA: EAL domain-containing protein [Polyangia bacterium]|nr:EAL domain-containing protein [Polyangia bacterium]
MSEAPDTVERLREALIDLERSRRRERELRAVETSMIDVVRVLAVAEHRRETFASLLDALREVLPFQEAAILMRRDDGAFRPIARTGTWMSALQLTPQKMLTRVLDGQIVVTFDANLIPEWRAQSAEVQAQARSIIHVPLRQGADAVLLVCTHPQPARFEQRHIELVKRIVPLAGQILQKLDLRDVLAAREQERQARLAMFNAIVSHMQAGVLVEDSDRRVFAANDILRAMFRVGPGADELISRDASALHASFAAVTQDPAGVAERTEVIVAGRALVLAEEIALADGRVVERDYVPVSAPDAGFIAHFWQYRDVTSRRKAEEQLRRQAFLDSLTGLPNRARFIEEVNAVLRTLRRHPERRAAVLFIDLDRFKVVNDRLGHAIGDQLLMAFVDRLRRCVRDTDVVGRLGGDEFTVLLGDIRSQREEVRIAQRILDSLRKPFAIADEQFTVTASIGLAACTPEHRSAEEVVRDADMAMYRAKADGKDCFRIFDQQLQEQTSRRLNLEQDLALCLERQQLVVYYQPIVELVSGRLRGFEALVRWVHPTLGLIGPDGFIPLAEESGQILAIDRWVLETAAAQFVGWQARYPHAADLRLAVNVSRHNIMRGKYPAVVADVIERTGIAARCLDIELTEGSFLEDVTFARQALDRLRGLGARVCIDDFGTGHSSLSMLARLAPNVMKMDRMFLADVESNPTSREIVRSVVALSRNIGIGVVAEGVEAPAQRKILIEDGCLLGQGNLFSPPVDASTAEQIVADGNALGLRGHLRACV